MDVDNGTFYHGILPSWIHHDGVFYDDGAFYGDGASCGEVCSDEKDGGDASCDESSS